ncbi:DUF1294 domain-containing protein [Pelagicoccus mobilis]|uniref:DUF1294 domain-containing protein n=1 Tax=Pelagicoccus mobilis TaxID=415221 RepID=A0A934S1P3_9BACT|nr:DUF1294 domain-containing protein [Pelagicoccus mobilis]MBK1879540.1 DUF1294 domain-containing protein [Pelagicoccus mobilis]
MPTPDQFAIALAALNCVSLLLFGVDKALSKTKRQRVSEKALLVSAALAAAPGALIGMVLFNHKTSKSKFRYGVPALLAAQAGVTYWLAYA